MAVYDDRTNTHRAVEVYFDGSCPLCRKEIDFYRRRTGAENVIWTDVSLTGSPAEDLGCAEAMARFHVRAADGRLVDGGRAFAALWLALPKLRWAGRLFLIPPLAWMIDRAYDAFLPVRPLLQSLATR